MTDTTARTAGTKKPGACGRSSDRAGHRTNPYEGDQLMEEPTDTHRPSATCEETRGDLACTKPTGHEDWHVEAGGDSWSTPLERAVYLHLHGAGGQVTSEVHGNRRVTTYGYVAVTADEIIAIKYGSDERWLAAVAQSAVLALAHAVKEGREPKGIEWRETTVHATDEHGTQTGPDIPCRKVDVTDEELVVRCARVGCDSEGELHEVSLFEDETRLAEFATHEVRVGDAVTLDASGDEPWLMRILDEEFADPAAMEALAVDVQKATTLANELNAPIRDQWRHVPGRHGVMWERITETVPA